MIKFMILSFVIIVIECNIIDKIEGMIINNKHSVNEKENKCIDIDTFSILEEYGFINIKQLKM